MPYRTITTGSLFVAILAATLSACSPSPAQKAQNSADAAAAASDAMLAATAAKDATATASSASPESSTGAWSYDDVKVALEDKIGTSACATSSEEVKLQPPYQNTTARLCVRRAPKSGLNVFIVLDGEGQITCEYDNCHVAFRFDGGPIKRFGASSGSADGKSNIIFIESEAKVASLISHSKRVTAAIQLYEAGTQEVEFKTVGLDMTRVKLH